MWLKAVICTTTAVLSLGLALGYWLKIGPWHTTKTALAQPTRAACTLSGDQRAGRRQVLASLWAQARETWKRDDGLAFEFAFDAETLDQVTDVISLETRCCSFLEFRLTARPSDDLLLLEIIGPEGIEDLMAGSISLAASLREADGGLSKEPAQANCCPGDGPCSHGTVPPDGSEN